MEISRIPHNSPAIPKPHDYRDLVIEQFADDERLLRERLRSVEADCESYQALARQGIQALAAARRQLLKLQNTHHRLKDEHLRLVDENRRLREQLLQENDEADGEPGGPVA